MGRREGLGNLTRLLRDRDPHDLASEVDVSRHGLSVASMKN